MGRMDRGQHLLSFANSDFFGQGIFNLVREKSGKCQGILLSMVCGNPVIVLFDLILYVPSTIF